MDSSNSNSVATKQDLQELNLETLASKEEIKGLATKEELKAINEELSFQTRRLATSIDELKAELRNTKNILQQAINEVAKKLDNAIEKQPAFRHTVNRHETRFDDHENRI